MIKILCCENTNHVDSENFILQGDCLIGFTAINLPEKIFYESAGKTHIANAIGSC